MTAICAITQAQNRSKGTITGTNLINTNISTDPAIGSIGLGAGVEAFRFVPGLVTQLDSGDKFTFEADKQWFSIGKFRT